MQKNRRKIERFINQPTLYIMVLLLGSSAGCVSQGNREVTQGQPSPLEQAAVPNNLNFIAEVVRNVGQAVVRIDATRTVEVPGSASNPLIERFFGEEFFPPQQRVQRGIGSGFIISPDGRILTNAHVVEDADEVKVVLKDGRRFAGKVVGADPVTDVAVIDVDGTNLPTVKLGNSDNLVPGQWAMGDKPPLALAPLVIL